MAFYLDHNATTKMYKGAIGAMNEVNKNIFGNPSSTHQAGEMARQALEGARSSIAGMIGCKPRELYFTSGGTEANNWLFHAFGAKLWYPSAIEHKSILRSFHEVCHWQKNRDDGILKVDVRGVVDLEFVKGALHAPGNMVSVMLANNETGVIEPVREVSDIVKAHSHFSLIHTDACQAFGKIPVHVDDLGVDLMTLSAHKVGGPKGVGALYVREDQRDNYYPVPMIRGGHQEWDKRAGTENVAGAVGFQAAARTMLDRRTKYTRKVNAYTGELWERLSDGLDGIWVNGAGAPRLPNTLNVGFPGVESDALVIVLSGLGVLVSNGSACEAGTLEGSHVLKAMGQSDAKSKSAIRFSFSDDLPAGAIDLIAERVIDSVKALSSMQTITL